MQTSTPQHTDESHPSIQEQFATVIGQTVAQAKSVGEVGEPWVIRANLHLNTESSLQTPVPVSVILSFEGDLAGDVTLCLAQKGAALLLGQDADDAAAAERAWMELLNASREALVQALEPVFGTVTISPGRGAVTIGRTPLAEVRVTNAPTAEPATISFYGDTALATSLERLAAATRVLSNDPDASNPGEDRERLHRVIDVPLAVTLRFGQRQMTLRELLALSTGSLVELDRQVEEPVELMLGERVIARGEVVIVDGNYGMRVLEVMEGAGRRIASAGM